MTTKEKKQQTQPAPVARNNRWSEALWDVSGAFVNDRELIAFHDFCIMALGFTPFSLVHGCPLHPWNSGRVIQSFIRTAEEIREAGLAYHERKISVDLTFTNINLKEKHINDQMGNALLEFFTQHNSNKSNGAIVVSDILADHIRKNYPTIKLVSSILKVSCEGGKGKLDYYKKLEENFDKVMLHPDDTFNWDLLEKIENKEKYEIIVNEYCVRNCKIRPLHYKSLSNLSLDYLGHNTSAFEEKLKNNPCQSLESLLFDETKRVSALANEEITRAYDMGFRYFKVQGRGQGNATLILFDLLRLILNEDAADENAMHRIKLQFLENILPLN